MRDIESYLWVHEFYSFGYGQEYSSWLINPIPNGPGCMNQIGPCSGSDVYLFMLHAHDTGFLNRHKLHFFCGAIVVVYENWNKITHKLAYVKRENQQSSCRRVMKGFTFRFIRDSNKTKTNESAAEVGVFQIMKTTPTTAAN